MMSVKSKFQKICYWCLFKIDLTPREFDTISFRPLKDLWEVKSIPPATKEFSFLVDLPSSLCSHTHEHTHTRMHAHTQHFVPGVHPGLEQDFQRTGCSHVSEVWGFAAVRFIITEISKIAWPGLLIFLVSLPKRKPTFPSEICLCVCLPLPGAVLLPVNASILLVVWWVEGRKFKSGRA